MLISGHAVSGPLEIGAGASLTRRNARPKRTADAKSLAGVAAMKTIGVLQVPQAGWGQS